MASQTTICAESINCNNFNTNHDKHNDFIIKVAKLTFDNTSSSDNFLKNAGFFKLLWPAHYYIHIVEVIYSGNSIDMGSDDTIINVADGTNSLLGGATNITIGSPPGVAGVIMTPLISFLKDIVRAKGYKNDTLFVSLNKTSKDVSSEDRVFTGVIYHDADGVNNGDGDGATFNDSLKTSVIYISFHGFRVPN